MTNSQLRKFISSCYAAKVGNTVEIVGSFGIMSRFDDRGNFLYSNIISSHPAINAMKDLATEKGMFE